MQKWLIVAARLVGRHIVPPLVVAVLAALADVGLLDGELYRAVAGLLAP